MEINEIHFSAVTNLPINDICIFTATSVVIIKNHQLYMHLYCNICRNHQIPSMVYSFVLINHTIFSCTLTFFVSLFSSFTQAKPYSASPYTFFKSSRVSPSSYVRSMDQFRDLNERFWDSRSRLNQFNIFKDRVKHIISLVNRRLREINS